MVNTKELVISRKKLPNGEQMAYRKYGHGPIQLILIHGNLSSSYFFHSFMDRWQDDFTMYAIDLIGFGDSSYGGFYREIDDWVEDVEFFIKDEGIETAMIAGWSAGGGIAMELCARHPKIFSHLFLLASVGVKGYHKFSNKYYYKPSKVVKKTYIPSIQDFTDFGKRSLNKWKEMLDQSKQTYGLLKEGIFDSFGSWFSDQTENYLVASQKQKCFFEFTDALFRFNITNETTNVVGNNNIAKIQCPVDWIHGDKDQVVPLEIAERSIEYFQETLGDQAKLHILPGVNHGVFLEDTSLFDETFNHILYS